MNYIALFSAFVGIAILLSSFALRRITEKKWLKTLIIAVAAPLSLIVAANLPALLSEDGLSMVALAGQYYLYLLLVIGLIKLCFFRKRKTGEVVS